MNKSMKKVLITQRVDFVGAYEEHRDALDQRWIDLLLQANLIPTIVPNNIEYVEHLIRHAAFEGVVLTGGNSLERNDGDSRSRDAVESGILDHAIRQGIPVLGVCRGMQVIQSFFKVQLHKVSNHVASRHTLQKIEHGKLSKLLDEMGTVNSYHNYGSLASNRVEPLRNLAKSPDGNIEAVEHVYLPIYGIMWHPEREQHYRSHDVSILEWIFNNR